MFCLCFAKDSPPKVQIYTRDPGHYDKPNILICHASGFYPPELDLKLLQDGKEIPGAHQTDLAFEEDWYYHLTNTLTSTQRRDISTPAPSPTKNQTCNSYDLQQCQQLAQSSFVTTEEAKMQQDKYRYIHNCRPGNSSFTLHCQESLTAAPKFSGVFPPELRCCDTILNAVPGACFLEHFDAFYANTGLFFTSSGMAAIGVHFGYTCACVAVFKDGRADVVANDAGDRVTPAIVAYRDNEQIVGIAAKQGRVRNAANTVVKVKHVLGRSFDDPETQAHKAETKCEVINKGDKPFYKIQLDERTEHISPQEVAKLIFHKMKETAQSALGSDVKEAVITVPFEFAQAQKTALREAAEAAGFHVLRLIHEPAAALLAYNIGQDSHSGKSHVLVYKLGGTSLSVTALQVSGGMYRVLHTVTDHSIGGERFTNALAQHLASEFKRSFRHDVSSNARAMLKL
ncbi:hypothetical protein WMY93_033695 [Mugilogobius chulae]|uniref:Immunoglobulin C1-set domain-containing protein n=1 Tax=Mugilogobius chulae TaxID=88201 RepID=A0AAW0MHG3_9GOBI